MEPYGCQLCEWGRSMFGSTKTQPCMRHAEPPVENDMVAGLYGQLCPTHQRELRAMAQQMLAPALYAKHGPCIWGRAMDRVILGAGDPPCDREATATSLYGGLCEEHAMEMRLRLLLLPFQMGYEGD